MDFSWSEMLVVAIVALVVIGPKDLPGMFRELGRVTAKLRSMGREFSRAMEQAAQESGVKDVADDLKKATSPKAMGLDAVKSAADRFEKWDPMKTKVTKPASAAATAAAAAPAAAEAPAMGPATAALAEKQAARKAVAQEAAEKLRKAAAPAPAADPAPAAPAKKPGRTRKKPAQPDGETA